MSFITKLLLTAGILLTTSTAAHSAVWTTLNEDLQGFETTELMIKELNAHSDYGNGTLMPFGAEDGSGHNSPRTFADGLASNQ